MLPSVMQNVKKRIVVKDIEGIKGKRYSNYDDEFDYLINSGITNEVKSVSTPVYPIYFAMFFRSTSDYGKDMIL